MRNLIGILRKKKKLKSIIMKEFLVFIFGLIFIEGFLWRLEQIGYLGIPYEWGIRNDIAFKINDCIELFNDPDNEDKIKIVIIGDSVAECGFNPQYLDMLFNKKTISYNLALAGTASLVHSLIIENFIIPKIKPDIIIWDISHPSVFAEKEDDRNNLTLSSPMGRYYTGNVEGLNFEALCKFYLLKYSRLYRYRLDLLPFFFGIKNDVHEYYQSRYDRGWVKKETSLITTERNSTFYNSIPYELDKDAVEMFFDSIKLIQEKTSYFLIVFPPHFKSVLTGSPYYSVIYNYSPKNFLDLNVREDFFLRHLWFDETHLNSNGSLYYTYAIYQKLSQNL